MTLAEAKLGLPTRPFLSIATSQWYAVHAHYGYEEGPFDSEKDAQAWCKAIFNEAHGVRTRKSNDPGDQLTLLAQAYDPDVV